MFNIADYLEKFKNIGQTERQLKNQIVQVISEAVGVQIETKQINIKNGAVVLKVSPGIKNSIFIKQNLILTKLNNQSELKIHSIR